MADTLRFFSGGHRQSQAEFLVNLVAGILPIHLVPRQTASNSIFSKHKKTWHYPKWVNDSAVSQHCCAVIGLFQANRCDSREIPGFRVRTDV